MSQVLDRLKGQLGEVQATMGQLQDAHRAYKRATNAVPPSAMAKPQE